MRRYAPDPDALAAALAARVDRLERDTQQAATDLASLGRGVAQLTAQIRLLVGVDAAVDGSGDGALVEERPAGQPDWLTVKDVETARAWLIDVTDWSSGVLPGHGLTVGAPCWPLHPEVVCLLLALKAERDAAYECAGPTAVSEWLTRWLPAVATRMSEALAVCMAERGHREGGVTYDASDLDSASVAAWWVTDRDLPAAFAFDLRRLT
jgi:hypothetical protein